VRKAKSESKREKKQPSSLLPFKKKLEGLGCRVGKGLLSEVCARPSARVPFAGAECCWGGWQAQKKARHNKPSQLLVLSVLPEKKKK